MPVALGVLLGANQAGVAHYFPWGISVCFWILASTGVWWILYLSTRLVAVALRPWQPNRWVIVILGALVGSLPARYLVFGCVQLFSGWMLEGREPHPLPEFNLNAEFLTYYLRVWGGVFLIWFLSNVITARWLGFPEHLAAPSIGVVSSADSPAVSHETLREGRSTPTAASVRAPILDKLPPELGDEIIALKAEDHYVRVYTEKGSALVLYRFADALKDLKALEGVRTHRSFWVRRSAVIGQLSRGRRMTLRLSNEIDIPVSQSYRGLVLEQRFSEL